MYYFVIEGWFLFVCGSVQSFYYLIWVFVCLVEFLCVFVVLWFGELFSWVL